MNKSCLKNYLKKIGKLDHISNADKTKEFYINLIKSNTSSKYFLDGYIINKYKSLDNDNLAIQYIPSNYLDEDVCIEMIQLHGNDMLFYIPEKYKTNYFWNAIKNYTTG
jgi:hypothetical protein